MVETRRFQAMGQLIPTCTAPPHELLAELYDVHVPHARHRGQVPAVHLPTLTMTTPLTAPVAALFAPHTALAATLATRPATRTRTHTRTTNARGCSTAAATSATALSSSSTATAAAAAADITAAAAAAAAVISSTRSAAAISSSTRSAVVVAHGRTVEHSDGFRGGAHDFIPQRVHHPRDVAAQVEFERHILKPGFGVQGQRFETRRLSAMDQGGVSVGNRPTVRPCKNSSESRTTRRIAFARRVSFARASLRRFSSAVASSRSLLSAVV
jgi:hypothetical protein